VERSLGERLWRQNKKWGFLVMRKVKFLGIPVIVIVIGLLVLSAGGAALAQGFGWFNSSANITVLEPLTYTVSGNATGWVGGSDGGKWTINMWPGESKSLTFLFSNNSPTVGYNMTATITGPPLPVVSFPQTQWSIPASSFVSANLTAVSLKEQAPGTFSYQIEITRQ